MKRLEIIAWICLLAGGGAAELAAGILHAAEGFDLRAGLELFAAVMMLGAVLPCYVAIYRQQRRRVGGET